MSNPFNKGTTSYTDFETMSDLKWHCTKCELQSGQAKTWQIWRQERGIQLDKDENDNWFKKIKCPNCQTKTVHRKLKSLKILPVTKARAGISVKTAQRVKIIYDNEEAMLLRKMPVRELEVDHKFPQIRWNTNEEKVDDYSDEELKNKFMLLSRSNNLLKSRHCERCFLTGKRGCFPGIKYWYFGTENWQGKTKYDEKGCEGCFWYNPYKWRESLQKTIKDNCNK